MGAPVVAGVAIGAAAGMAQSWVFAGGDPSKRDLVIGGTLGAIPGGLGVRGTLQVASKLSRLRHFSTKAGDKIRHIPAYFAHPASRIYMGMESSAIAKGMAGGVIIGMAYDKLHSSGGGSGTGTTTSSTQRPARGGPSTPQRASRSPSSGRRRRRCKHRNKAGKQCLRPAGHSGRHRYR